MREQKKGVRRASAGCAKIRFTRFMHLMRAPTRSDGQMGNTEGDGRATFDLHTQKNVNIVAALKLSRQSAYDHRHHDHALHDRLHRFRTSFSPTVGRGSSCRQ